MSVSYSFILRAAPSDFCQIDYFQRLITEYHKLNNEPFWFSFDSLDLDSHVLIGKFGKGNSYDVFIQALMMVNWPNTDSVQIWIYSDHSGGVRYEEVNWEAYQSKDKVDFQFCCHDKCGEGCPSSKNPSPYLREWMRCKDDWLRVKSEP